MAGGFQTAVGYQPAPGVAGDFASSNPRSMYPAGPGGLVAGAAGVTVGNFAWVSASSLDQDNSPQIVNSFGFGAPDGFVHREQQAIITTYLADATMLVPQGFPITLLNQGDFSVKNSGSGQAYVKQKAYANPLTGAVSFAAAGTPGTVTAATSAIAAATFSVTGSVSGNVLTVTAVGSGNVVPGATISGTGIATGTQIVSQLSGTANGVGTYALNYGEQTAASTTVSGTYGILTLGATPSGTFVIGALLSGTSVVAGTYVTAYISGNGTANGNTLVVNNNTVVSSTTITATNTVETKYYAGSSGASGEIVKVTSWIGTQG